MVYSLQEPEKKIELITTMLDAFGFKANDTQLAVYIDIGQSNALEDVATCTAAFMRGDVEKHENKQFPPSTALFGDTVHKYKIERLRSENLKAPKLAHKPVKKVVNKERADQLREGLKRAISAYQVETGIKKWTPEQAPIKEHEIHVIKPGDVTVSPELLKSPLMKRASYDD